MCWYCVPTYPFIIKHNELGTGYDAYFLQLIAALLQINERNVLKFAR